MSIAIIATHDKVYRDMIIKIGEFELNMDTGYYREHLNEAQQHTARQICRGAFTIVIEEDGTAVFKLEP